MPKKAEHSRAKEPASLAHERERFEALKRAITGIGFLRRGTLTQVRVCCGKKSCACATNPDKRHGPYVQWTGKVGGKMVSERVAAKYLPLMEQWLRNAKELDRLLSELQQVSLNATRQILHPPREQAPAEKAPAPWG